jgi:hypothetical protein
MGIAYLSLLLATSVFVPAQTTNSPVTPECKPSFKESRGMVIIRFYRIGCGVTPVLVQSSRVAKFPDDLRKKYQSQVVVFSIVVDDGGNINNGRLLLTPDSKLTAPAMEALRRSKFSPARLHGKPVWTEVLAEIQISDGKMKKSFRQDF